MCRQMSVTRTRLWHRLSVRLGLIITLAVVLTSGFSLFAALDERRREISAVVDETVGLSRAAALFQDDMIRETQATLFALGSLPAIRTADWDTCSEAFANELQAHPMFRNLGLVGRDGILLCSAIPQSRELNVSHLPFFQRTMISRSFSMGSYQIDRTTGKPAINFGAPVFDAGGTVRYVVFAAMDMRWFEDLAGKLPLPTGATLEVFTGDGTVLVGYPVAPRWAYRKLSYADVTSDVLRRGPSTTERVGVDGIRRIYGVTRLSVTPAYADTYLSVGIPVSLALARVHKTFLTSLLLTGLVGLFAVLLALEGSALYVQRPLDAVTSAAKRLASGDLDARAGSPSIGGELRQVIGAFDEMAVALQRRTEALRAGEEIYRSLVDRVPVGLFRTSADGRFLQLNPAALEIIGYPNFEAAACVGVPSSYADPEDRRRWWALIEHDGTMENFEFRLRRGDGSIVWVRERVRVVRDEHGGLLYFEGFIEDITELHNAHVDLRRSYDQTIEGWSRALDLRDRETQGHSQRVARKTLALARAMGVAEANLIHIWRGALLHDIGKMGVPDAILLKPAPLTEAERETMQRHPVYARELLCPIAYLHQALDIPYSHHERWDGTGYPQGLTGDKIPLAARMFSIIDVWDALRSDRPYRSAWNAEAARAYISLQAGKQFDPQVVEKFLELLDHGGLVESDEHAQDGSDGAIADGFPPVE
jgi:PAS domain S-box-containing protein/putative nucleotidyltransferase with HDIG domain